MKAESPCTQICRLDANEICIGCLRTRDEIARWSAMTESEKVAILVDMDNRRDSLTTNRRLAGRRQDAIALFGPFGFENK